MWTHLVRCQSIPHPPAEAGALNDESPEAPRPGNVRDPEGLELHDLRQALGHQPLERAVFDVRGDGRVGEVLRLLPVEAVQVVDGVVAKELNPRRWAASVRGGSAGDGEEEGKVCRRALRGVLHLHVADLVLA